MNIREHPLAAYKVDFVAIMMIERDSNYMSLEDSEMHEQRRAGSEGRKERTNKLDVCEMEIEIVCSLAIAHFRRTTHLDNRYTRID